MKNQNKDCKHLKKQFGVNTGSYAIPGWAPMGSQGGPFGPIGPWGPLAHGSHWPFGPIVPWGPLAHWPLGPRPFGARGLSWGMCLWALKGYNFFSRSVDWFADWGTRKIWSGAKQWQWIFK